MARDFRNKQLTSSDVNYIVEGDKSDIDAADIVLVYPWKSSSGTAMEIIYAWSKGKLVLTVFEDHHRLSPWISYHSNFIFNSMAEAIAYLRKDSV